MMDKTVSQSMEFKEMTQRDAERSLAMELEKLKRTGNLPEFQSQMIDKEFNGFQRLFKKFLESAAPIEWEKIEKLPADAVSLKINRKNYTVCTTYSPICIQYSTPEIYRALFWKNTEFLKTMIFLSFLRPHFLKPVQQKRLKAKRHMILMESKKEVCYRKKNRQRP